MIGDRLRQLRDMAAQLRSAKDEQAFTAAGVRVAGHALDEALSEVGRLRALFGGILSRIGQDIEETDAAAERVRQVIVGR